MTSKIGVGLIGAGKMGITHCGALMRFPDRARVESVYDLHPEKSKVLAHGPWPDIEYYEGAFEQTHTIPHQANTVDDLLSHPHVQAVVIATPNTFHFEMVRKALEAGKHVLVEKPMTLDYDQAKELVELAARVNRGLHVGQCWRFHPDIQYAKKVLQAGWIGDVVKIKGFGIHESYLPQSTWFTKKTLSGGGALIDMGVHPIDTIFYLLPDLSLKSAYALMKTAYGNYDVEDIGLGVLSFNQGAAAAIEFGWANPHIDGLESSIQIFGTKGYLRIFPTSIKIWIEGEKGTFTPFFSGKHMTSELYVFQAQHFLDALDDPSKSIISGQNNLMTMKVLDALYLSFREHRVVFMDEYK